MCLTWEVRVIDWRDISFMSSQGFSFDLHLKVFTFHVYRGINAQKKATITGPYRWDSLSFDTSDDLQLILLKRWFTIDSFVNAKPKKTALVTEILSLQSFMKNVNSTSSTRTYKSHGCKLYLQTKPIKQKIKENRKKANYIQKNMAEDYKFHCNIYKSIKGHKYMQI